MTHGRSESEGPLATIDLEAYRRNITTVRDRIAPAQLMAVIKADAYGHGLAKLTKAALDAGAPWLGALDSESALEVRRIVGDETPVFAWLFSPLEDYAPLVDARIDLGISHGHQLERIAASGSTRSARIHLKIDTGLHRNGADPDDWPRLVSRTLELQRDGRVELVGAWTHIGEASEADDTNAIRAFESAVVVAESLGAHFEVRHLAASAAGYSRPDARFDVVRVGAFTYGIAPGDGIGPSDIGLEPVMTVTAPVVGIDAEEVRIAIGYLDGLPAAAANKALVAVGGELVEVTAVEASITRLRRPSAGIRLGQLAAVFGSGRFGEWTLQQWADATGTIGEEFVVRIGPRLDRRFLD